MFLSHAVLKSNAAMRQLLHSPYELHHQAWRFFSTPAGQPRDFLYRVELEQGRVTYYLQSQQQPLEEGQLGGLWRMETHPFEPRFANGDCFRFKIRVNPSKSQAREGQRGRRIDAVLDFRNRLDPQAAQQMTQGDLIQQAGVAWLARRGERNGFQIQPDQVRASRYQSIVYTKTRDLGQGKPPVQLGLLDLSGLLQVSNAALFANAVEKGPGLGQEHGLRPLPARSGAELSEAWP